MKKLLTIFRSRYFRWSLLIAILIVSVAACYGASRAWSMRTRFSRIGVWMAEPAAQPGWLVKGGERCGEAPMLFPSSSFIGVRWNDGLAPLYQHSGFDIFSPDGADNVTPIYAAYDGFLTRESQWRSAVIVRHPDFEPLPDLVGGEQIWTYYTHLASRDGTESFIEPDFPPGTREVFVEAGTLLGYQGSWSGSPTRDLSRHLHFSVVKSGPTGAYTNETQISNTLDPAPFLGVTANAADILVCAE